MTRREVTILLTCTAILAFLLGLWSYAKFFCPKERGLDTETVITKWRDVERKVRDTITRVEVRKEQLAGEVVTVTEYIDRLDSLQLDSCTKDVEPRQLCLEHSLFPLHVQQIANDSTLIGLQSRQIDLKENLIGEYVKEQKNAAKRLKTSRAKLRISQGFAILFGIVSIFK